MPSSVYKAWLILLRMTDWRNYSIERFLVPFVDTELLTEGPVFISSYDFVLNRLTRLDLKRYDGQTYAFSFQQTRFVSSCVRLWKEDKPAKSGFLCCCLSVFVVVSGSKRNRDTTVVLVGHSSSLFSTTHSSKYESKTRAEKRSEEQRKTERELASKNRNRIESNLYI